MCFQLAQADRQPRLELRLAVYPAWLRAGKRMVTGNVTIRVEKFGR